MRHRVKGRHLSRSSDHRRALYRNLVTDVLDHEKVRTTAAKASEVQALAEKMITLGKRGDVHARRQALAYVLSERVVRKVFGELAERYGARPGGYTRIVKLGSRLGDAAPLVQLELIESASS